MEEIYVSVDCEFDGPTPGTYSMLSLGAVAFLADGTEHSRFSVNLKTLPGASTHPVQMNWWKKHPEAWQETRKNPIEPAKATRMFIEYVKDLPGFPIFVAYPLSVDWMFCYWYMMNLCGECPFQYSNAVDINSYALGILGVDFTQVCEEVVPDEWGLEEIMAHIAVNDAYVQGMMYFAIKQYRAKMVLSAVPAD